MERFPSEIITPRLHVRLWRQDDARALTTAITESLEHLRPWLAWTRFEPLDVDDRARLIETGNEQWANGGDASYGVFVGRTSVGGCGLHRRQGPGSVDLGYWIHVDHIGNGYATEAARALTAAAFEVARTERVEVHHDRANHRSGAVARSLGFVAGGEHEDGIESPGEVGIDCSWSISRDAWTARSLDDGRGESSTQTDDRVNRG